MWKHLKRVVKPNGAIVMTTSQPFTSHVVMSNIKWFSHELIWEKSNGGGFLNANRQPLKRHENIIIFWGQQGTYNPEKIKGKSYRCTRASAGETTFDQSVSGWVTHNKGDRFPTSILKFMNETGYHPTQKPVTLMGYMIKTYTNEGDIVLDFCCGSGTTGVACKRWNRNFILIEKEAEYCEIARRRLAAEDNLFSEVEAEGIKQ